MKTSYYSVSHVNEKIQGKNYEKFNIIVAYKTGGFDEVMSKFDREKNICRIYEINTIAINYLSEILPADCDIWYFGEDISDLIKLGFTNPFYCKVCPFGEVFKKDVLAIHRKNDPNFDTNSRERYNGDDTLPEKFQKRRSSPKRKTRQNFMLEFIEDNLKNKKPIELRLKFDSEDLNYLRKLIKGSNTLNEDGKITQKEVSGTLHLEKTKKEFLIKLDKTKKFNAHDEDSVRLVEGLINFHTHPESIYNDLNVNLMYPSPDDYMSILTLLLQPYFFENNEGSKSPVLFSCVVTLEGIYIISLNKNYCTKDKVKKLRDNLCDTYDGISELKYNVRKSMSSYHNQLTGFIYGDDIDLDVYFDTHCKYIGDPKDHPLGYHQIGGFDFNTFKHNRKIEQLLHFPESVKQGRFTYDRTTQAAKDYCLKMNRRELITGTKFKDGPVLDVQFYNYEELENREFFVYTYTQESEVLTLQPFLDEETIENAIEYSSQI